MIRPPNQLMIKLYHKGLGRLVGGMILLLSTTGRKSGKTHTVALQYEKVGEKFYLGAGGGPKSDWFRNIQMHPNVTLFVHTTEINGIAEAVTDPDRIAEFLALRLKKHPLMIGMILKSDGLSFRPSKEALLEYSNRLAMVIITPFAETSS